MNFPNDFAERRQRYLDGITAQAWHDCKTVMGVRERLRKPYPYAMHCDELLAKRASRQDLDRIKRAVIEIADRIIRNATPRSPEEIARMWPETKAAA